MVRVHSYVREVADGKFAVRCATMPSVPGVWDSKDAATQAASDAWQIPAHLLCRSTGKRNVTMLPGKSPYHFTFCNGKGFWYVNILVGPGVSCRNDDI